MVQREWDPSGIALPGGMNVKMEPPSQEVELLARISGQLGQMNQILTALVDRVDASLRLQAGAISRTKIKERILENDERIAAAQAEAQGAGDSVS